MMNDLDFSKYVDLLKCPTFWTLAIGTMEYLLYEHNMKKIKFDKIDTTYIDEYIDEVVDVTDNEYAYLNIINETTSPFYRLQFVFMRSKNHSRRKVLSTVRDIVIDLIKLYLTDKKYDISGQTCIPSDLERCKLDTEFTLDYVIEFAYEKFMNDMSIPKSKYSDTIRNILSTYILCVCVEIIYGFGEAYFAEWLEQHNL